MKIIFLTITFLSLFYSSQTVLSQDTEARSDKAIINLSNGISFGKAVKLRKPPFPSCKCKYSKNEKVIVQAEIDELGNVIFAKAISGHPVLRAAGEIAARNSKFSPTVEIGNSIKAIALISYTFIVKSKIKVFVTVNSIHAKQIKYISHLPPNSKPINIPYPEYSSMARAAGASGRVDIEILIDEKGNIEFAKPISGHPLLWGDAVKAAKLARFKPTIIGGKSFKVKSVIVYNFVL
jgi:TonB family protein